MSNENMAERPSQEEIAKSVALTRRIVDKMANQGGAMAFSDYMNMVLYEPGLGYYSSNSRIFGSRGDFVTAPGLTSLFGATIAKAIRPFLELTSGNIYEFGAGTGALAADILGWFKENPPEKPFRSSGDGIPTYNVIELSADLMEKQRESVEKIAPGTIGHFGHLSELPEKFDGVVLANELLDAMPCDRIYFDPDKKKWMEAGVALSQKLSSKEELEKFMADDELAARLIESMEVFETKIGEIPAKSDLMSDIRRNEPLRELSSWLGQNGEDYMTETNRRAKAFAKSVAERFGKGLVIFVDYGYNVGRYYDPGRNMGTLMGHYKHRVTENPYFWPGLQDVTASVEFTGIADALNDAGMEFENYMTQADFLIHNGILDLLGAMYEENSVEYLRHAQAVNTLTSPHQMGENFKFLIFRKGIDGDLIDFGPSAREGL